MTAIDETTDTDQVLGQTAALLYQRGNLHAAALMTDVGTLRFDIKHYEPMTRDSDIVAVLATAAYLVPRFSPERLEEILGAMRVVTETTLTLAELRVVDLVPQVGPDWRQQLSRELRMDRPSNSARSVRLNERRSTIDDLTFTNDAEERVYAVLKRAQEGLPTTDTIGILPLAAMRVLGHTFEPDFLVTYRGKAGVIEVDGPHHTGRADTDKGRERHMRDSGVRYVDRINIRDTTDQAEVESFVRTFLVRLSGAR